MKRLLAGLCCALLFAGCDDDKKERERTSGLNTRVAKGNPELRLSGTDSSSILRFYAIGALNGGTAPAETGLPPRGASWSSRELWEASSLGTANFWRTS